MNEDLYINYAARDGNKATLQAYVFPLVTWIWVGAVTLIFGTLVALVPAKISRSYTKTEVVGTMKGAVGAGSSAAGQTNNDAAVQV